MALSIAVLALVLGEALSAANSAERAGGSSGYADGILGVSLGDPLGMPPSVGATAPVLRSPRSIAAAMRSRTEFADLSAARAARVDRTAFPAQIARPAGGPPSLPKGQRIVRIESPRVAQIELPHGKHAAVESMQPMAVETSRGHYSPVDLAPKDEEGVYVPTRPLVGVTMPQHADEGIALPQAGISLTPVNAHGVALGGSRGAIDGASVLYANTQANVDTVVRPMLAGVETSTILRAANSPSTVYLRVALPVGARLVQPIPGVSPVRLVEGSRTVAVVRPPGAVDAAGREVPTSMRVLKGSLLAVSVSVKASDYQLPIEVDPEIVYDEAFGERQCHQEGEAERESSNWCWSTNGGFKAYWYTHAVEMWNEGAVGAGAYTVMSYKTQGESKIYEVEGYTDGEATRSEAKVEFARQRSVEEGELEVSPFQIVRNGYKAFANNQFCVSSGCPSTAGSNGNLVAYKVEAYESSAETYVDFGVQNTRVYIAQEKAPEPSLNTTEEHPQGDPERVNVAYTHGWLSPAEGAFEIIVHDPGIGVSEAGINEMGGKYLMKAPIYEAHKCNGVQCNETYRTAITYSPEMADGEDKFEVWGRDRAGLFGYIGFYQNEGPVIKIDGTPPGELEVTGWSARREVSAATHALTVSARDEAPEGKKSSGVKSITLSIDGSHETTLTGASCAEGPCTATATYTLHAEDLSEGVHRLVETTTDNAGNVAAKEFTFDVRHGTPVPIGPGSVDPTTGQFKLDSTDVSLAGAGGVSRVYQSRDLTAGAGGPLGPQWALSLGGGQGLTQLPDGSMVLSSANGGTTAFLRNEEDEYESPLGDENIKVEAKEGVPGQGISEYLLKDAKAGTTTVFTQPKGTDDTAPIYAGEFGQGGAGLGNPVSASVDAHGNVWMTDYTKDRILEFSAAGVLLKSFGTEGSWPNEFRYPWGIAVDKATGNVYVSDPGNSRIVELSASGQFVRAFGWGTKPGGERQDAFQDCTEYCYGGIAGSGPGQLNVPQGVAIGPEGNVWVAEFTNNRIQVFSAEGDFLASYGSAGTGDGQFAGPMDIAFSGGDLYVTDQNNNRVQELNTEGVFVKAIGWGVSNGESKLQVCTSGCRPGVVGTGDGEFHGPRGLAIDAAGDMYVSEIYNDRVQELTTEGGFITKFGEGGSGHGQFTEPMGVALGSSGEVFVTDFNNSRVQEWMHPTWLPVRTEGELEHVTTAYAYEPVQEEGKVVIEPTEVLAATPAGIKCVGEHGEVEARYLNPGCRALTFNYAEATTAKGEAPSEWGDYVGHLTRVYFHAAVPGTGAMASPAPVVAHYLYDAKGRLRAVWDPRTEPKPGSEECVGNSLAKGCLATTYGYDEEGHLTSVTPPGQESWALVYGTIPRDLNPGRLLKVTRASASAHVWTGEATSATEAPRLSGTPVVGVRMAVSDGRWTGAPISYAYQWEDCNAGGGECVAIAGATNPNYVPKSTDVGHALLARVTATNGGGSVTVAGKASAVVASTWQEHSASKTQLVDGASSINAVSCIPESTECVVSDANGNAFYATNVSTAGTPSWKAWSGPGVAPSEAVSCPAISLCVMAAGEKGKAGIYYATVLGGGWTLGFGHTSLNPWDAVSCASTSLCVAGEMGERWIAASTSPASTSWKERSVGGGSGSTTGVDCLSSSFCATVDSTGHVHVTTGGVEGTWTETDVDGSSALNGIACTSSSECLAVDSNGNVVNLAIAGGGAASTSRQNIDAANRLNAISCSGSTCATVDSKGNVFTSTDGGQVWSEHYSPGGDLTGVSCASGSLCVTVSAQGETTAFNPSGIASEASIRSPQPGTTVEYNVPVSGEGAPQSLSKTELEKWAQADDPSEATAIFPPDEPQSWPASGYKKATIDYMDEEGRTVNTRAPGGGIATTEYNEANEVVRTLSPQNRVRALAEGAKSVEVAEHLSTITEYNPSDNQIAKTLGPEHKIKLANGEEVQARAVTHNYYNEGAQQAEEKNEEEYNLLTRSVSGALLASGEEVERRTTLTSYSGQDDLGWVLREPTSTTVDPKGIDMVTSTKYDKETGAVEETRSPGGNSEEVWPPSFSLHFGTEGSGNGQFKEPQGVAVDAAGDVWTLDTGNDRVEKFSGAGGFDAVYGALGTGDLQFEEPKGIAVNRGTGDVYVADSGNNRIEVLGPAGEFVEAIGWGVSDGKAELEACKAGCRAGLAGAGNGQLSGPLGITVDSKGDIWVADAGNDRVQEFSGSGVYLRQFGSEGSGDGQLREPTGVAISEGSVYVADHRNHRVQQFSMTGAYVDQFGGQGTGAGQFEEPYGIAANPSTGVLYVCDPYNSRMEEFSPAGKFLTEWQTWSVSHEQYSPHAVAVSATGDLYIVDRGSNVVGEWIPPEAGGAHLSFSTQFASKGSGEGQLSEPEGAAVDGEGDLWVADWANDRIEEFSAKGAFLAAYGKEGSGEGQFHAPSGLAINKSTGDIYVTDTYNNRVEELSSTGAYIRSFGTEGPGALYDPHGAAIDSSGNVWVADRSDNRVVEFSATGSYIAAYGSAGTGELQFRGPQGIAISGEDVYVGDSINHRVEELTTKGAYVRTFGMEGSGSGEFFTPIGLAVDAAGNIYVSDINADHVEEFSPTGAYKATFGRQGTGEGQLTHPTGIAINPAGDLYIVDEGNDRIELWDNNHQLAHDTKTIYYTPGEEASVPACQSHPEWAGLTCRTEPVAQPEDTSEGMPSLPVMTITAYNIWDEAETTTRAFGSVTRTTTQTYDAAGRAITSEETSTSTDEGLPKVTNAYNEETGALESQSATIDGEVKTTTAKDNTLGQIVEYKDATGNVAKYAYEEGEDGDGRLLEVSEGNGEEAKSKQSYSYDETTGLMTKLVDSGAGTFTASYDLEGQMVSEVYPNGMCANTSYDSVGAATSISYIKTRNCAESNPTVWFSDSVVPGIYGETLSQESTLSKESYAYDEAGRLLETQETPSGKGCVTRLYAYDEESNRTSQATREPGAEGKCATEGGTLERHVYDEANRLTDEGVEYEALGNTMRLPAVDAGGHALRSTYYVDGQVATQEQNSVLDSYIYDPAGRTMQTTSENPQTKASATVISHYAGPGEAVTWTSENEKWTRNIPGIGGGLEAIEEQGKEVLIQLHDLQGNIVATAVDNETETKLHSTYNSTEFGVPSEGKTPPKYAWLGAGGVATETAFETGVSTQGGASYVPQIARNLQTGAVEPPGAFPNGQGTGEQYGSEIPGWYISLSTQESAATLAEWTAKQEALRREAEEAARSAAEETQEIEAARKEGVLEEEELGVIVFEPAGDKAVAAGIVTCAEFGVHWPHQSKHFPDTVNWIVEVKCNKPVVDLRMRAQLRLDNEVIEDTGWNNLGSTSEGWLNVSAPCQNGWWHGQAWMVLDPPPGYIGPTKSKGWSPRRYITCQ